MKNLLRKFKWFKILSWTLIVIIGVHGTVGFSMFIFEEAMQTMMFASFAYSNAEDWEGLSTHVDKMSTLAYHAEVWVYRWGWLAFFMYEPYKQYIRANDAYIESQRNLVRWKLG